MAASPPPRALAALLGLLIAGLAPPQACAGGAVGDAPAAPRAATAAAQPAGAAGGPRYKPVDPLAVRKVHVVASNHLDVGFADFAEKILDRYFTGEMGTAAPPLPRNQSLYYPSFFVSAARTAQALRRDNSSAAGLRYMAQSYLVSYFLLNCSQLAKYPRPPHEDPVRCPNSTEVAEVEAAIRRGDIYWHAFPHNAQPEVMDAAFFRHGLQQAASLARRYGQTPSGVLSQRDVPGLTRAAVPLLAGAGALGVSVGVNDGSPAPIVPSTVDCYSGFRQVRTPFLWRDAASGTDVVADFHPGGYGGIIPIEPESGVPYYSRDGILCDCVGLAGLEEVLCYAWRGDNYGPAGVAETKQTFAEFQKAFPAATVTASSLTAYFEYLQPHKGSLPVVTQEIGDTWVYGVASDPLKLAQMRAMMRARAGCDAACAAAEPGYDEFSRFVMKLPEHTWGSCGCGHMHTSPPTDAWSQADLARAIGAAGNTSFYAIEHASWVEQRAFVKLAVEALGGSGEGVGSGGKSALQAAIVAEFSALQAPAPTAASLERDG